MGTGVGMADVGMQPKGKTKGYGRPGRPPQHWGGANLNQKRKHNNDSSDDELEYLSGQPSESSCCYVLTATDV